MEFKINRGSGKCSISGREFADGETYIVALKPDGEQEGAFQRVDIGMEAWERQGAGGYTAWWPTVFSKNRKPALLDPDAMWQVFHRATGPRAEGETFTEAELQRFAFVAALGLMRMKKLKLKGTRRAGKQEFFVYETPGRSAERRTFEVLNPALDEAGIEQVQEKLSEL